MSQASRLVLNTRHPCDPGDTGDTAPPSIAIPSPFTSWLVTVCDSVSQVSIMTLCEGVRWCHGGMDLGVTLDPVCPPPP